VPQPPFASGTARRVHRHVDPHAETAEWRIARVEGGVSLWGRLRAREAPALIAAIRDATTGIEAPTIDLTGVAEVDGGFVALLRADLAERRVPAQLRGGDRFGALLDLYGNVAPTQPRKTRRPEAVLCSVGRVAVLDVAHLNSILAFTGQMAVAIGRLLRSPRRGGHWKEFPSLAERAGGDALPIVLVINFLIGFVLAYMAARALTMFGANIYVADLVGIGMTRQLGPLMTAVIVCGRSGAAYATELGSMKVDQEIDALRTLGLEPFGWLAMPRLLSLVVALPVLTLLADIVGMCGGLVVATTSLDLTPRGYYGELRSTLTPWDVESGLILSLSFAIAIGLIACERGFTASGGPQGVGRRTTSAVVTSLFAIVVLDASITVLYRAFGLS
jgi:phospholipid/cholesterol/gamma-HCH transport system permease protein